LYNLHIGETTKNYQFGNSKLQLYQHSFSDGTKKMGIKTAEGKLLLYPVFDSIDILPSNIINVKQDNLSVSLDISKLNPLKTLFQVSKSISCFYCQGKGHDINEIKVAAAVKPKTKETVLTTWER